MMAVILGILGVVGLVFGVTAFTGAPYVPSRKKDVEGVFSELCSVGAGDLVIDIGMGDGRVVMAAARRGARATGVEINPFLVLVGKWRMRKMPRTEVKWGNFKRMRFPKETTVVYTFGDSRDIGAMYELVEREAGRIGRKIRLISYGFEVPGKKAAKKWGAYYLYEVGLVAGKTGVEIKAELEVKK